MPKLTIDGQPLEVPSGTNLIEAARRIGIEIPHYCYHPALSIAGQCRLCVIDIEKVPRPQVACNTVVPEGMAGHTETERWLETRKPIMGSTWITNRPACRSRARPARAWLRSSNVNT